MKREEVLSVAKPILFNTDMVRAILDGRKTVTRRLLKPRYRDDEGGFQICRNEVNPDNWYVEKTNEDGGSFDNTRYIYPPYNPDDYLYVRETWCLRYDGEKYFYKADKNTTREENQLIDYDNISWKPSIHMQKEAARIFLKVKNVLVERLQDIDDEQAKKEGCNDYSSTALGFCCLWDSTIKKSDLDKYGWDANPWVWVIEFERVNAE